MNDRDIEKLNDAVKFSNKNYPLPRCIHGTSLFDHSGTRLYPSCGCGKLLDDFINRNTRPEPEVKEVSVKEIMNVISNPYKVKNNHPFGGTVDTWHINYGHKYLAEAIVNHLKGRE